MGTLLGKPANQEDGEIVSQRTILPRFGYYLFFIEQRGGDEKVKVKKKGNLGVHT